MKDKNKVWSYLLWIVFAFFYSLLCIKLFFRYREFIITDGTDMQIHIERALMGGGYSLCALSYRMINGVCLKLGINVINLFALFNILLPALTVPTSAIFLKGYIRHFKDQEIPVIYALWFSLASLFFCFIRMSGFYSFYYRNDDIPNLSPIATQPWHNDTYSFMRLFAGIALLYFFLLFQEISEYGELSKKNAVLFTVFLFLSNFAKPSFGICFAPAAFLLCLWDFLKKGKKVFSKYVIVGICILVSFSCIPFQFERLYGDNTESGIVVTLERIMSGTLLEWSGIFILSLAFPVAATIVLCILTENRKTLKYVVFAWILFGLSLVIKMLFMETGPRSVTNNFSWTAMIAAYFLFLQLIAELYTLSERTTSKLIIVPWSMLALHLYTGVNYFLKILGGDWY